MRRLILSLIFGVAMLGNLPVQANIFPSDPIELKQPNGFTFKARFFGDEFLSWAETLDGYTIEINPNDGYWCFAQRGVKGNLVASIYQVGKVDPLNNGLVQHLRPSQEIIDRAELEREEFNSSLMKRSTTGTKTLGVILIEFPEETGGSYSNEDYEVLFFSEDYYNTRNNHVQSPDLEDVFGSIRDYFLEVSYGSLSITGDILNNSISGSYQWLMADTTKDFYSFNTTYKDTLIKEAVEKARTAHQSILGFKNPDDYDIICVYYAGNVGAKSGALWMHCATDTAYKFAYINGEKTYQGPHTFNHIGGHCHEIGHQIGLTDKYTGIREVGKYGVMSKGNWNGPNGKGECPAHITAVGKIQLGWVSPNVISSNTSVTLNPVENSASSVYEIISDNTTNYAYYILENRSTLAQFSSFDQYLPGRKDCNGGLLIWALDYHSYSVERFVAADNDFDILATDGGDYFPGTTNNTDFDGITEPSSNFGINNDIASGLSVHNVSKNVLNWKINCDLVLNEWIGKIITSLSWNDSISVIGDVFVHADTIGGDTLSFSSFSKKSKFGNKHTQFTQSMIDDDVILTISSGSVVYLNGHLVESSGTKGGIINRENNVAFIPDIQLLKNGTSLIGQYSDISSAISAANSGDEIVVNGNITVSSDITVPSGLTLTIQPSAVIKFASGTELLINGTLNAQGTSANPITFTSASASPAAGDWDWIKFDGGTGTMEYCNIEYARFGLWFYGASSDPTVENCTMENCSYYGAYFLNNSATTFQYNTITDNSLHGLLLINSSPTLLNVQATDNSDNGLFLNNASPKIGSIDTMFSNQSQFSNNSDDGIFCSGSSGSHPWIYRNSVSNPNGGYVRIIGNDGDGLTAQDNSQPILGSGSEGYNSIYNNTDYQIRNNNSSYSLPARYNWWGDDDGPPIGAFYGTVLAVPYLDYQPGGGVSSGNSSAPVIALRKTNVTSDSLLERAQQLMTMGKYGQAVQLFVSIIQDDPNSTMAQIALTDLVLCYREMGTKNETLALLDQYVEDYNRQQIGYWAMNLSLPLLEMRGDYEMFIERCALLRTEFDGKDDLADQLAFDLGMVYKYGLQDQSSAKAYFEEFIKQKPDDPLADIAHA